MQIIEKIDASGTRTGVQTFRLLNAAKLTAIWRPWMHFNNLSPWPQSLVTTNRGKAAAALYVTNKTYKGD